MPQITAQPTFPFKNQPDKEIGRGVEFRVLRHGDGWVVKEGIHPVGNTLEQLKEDKDDYELFCEFIDKFLPETHHLRGHNAEGKACNIILQREIQGRPLHELSDDELFNNPEITAQLKELFQQCEEMWQTRDRIFDICGSTENIFRVHNPRYARNIMVENETNRVWLVDTSASTRVFSKTSPLKRRAGILALRTMMKRLIGRLDD